MSADPGKDTHGATTIRASKNGGSGGKWLLGAVAAVAVIGGGYAAWQTLSPPQERAQIADNSPYADDLRAGPLDPNQLAAEDDLTNAAPPAEAASAEAPAPTPARTRTAAAARPAPAAEETIGITLVNATAGDPNDDIVITARRPIWARTPSPRQLSALYPQRALDRGQEGEAQLACTVQQGGALACERVSETPGFGYPAMRVARTLRHAPTLADGRNAVGSNVNLRVMFRIAEQEARTGGARLRS